MNGASGASGDAAMGEMEFVERLSRRARAVAGKALTLGIGDDCAIIRPGRSSEALLLTTDLVIESVHFLPDVHQPEAVGYRTLARGLSDIAAMGGEPRCCLVSLALPRWADGRWVGRFFSGLLALARQVKTPLAGGDVAHADRFSCDIVVCGAVPRGRALRRDGARPGDAVYVSGVLGGSALGLEARAGPAWRRHLRPEPRLALGRYLRTRSGVTAAMDLSDGLSMDLHRLCRASRVAARIEAPLPGFPGAALDHILHGGEDYELLFTTRAGARIPPQHQGVLLTRIGTIVERQRPWVTYLGMPLAPLGYDHLRAR